MIYEKAGWHKTILLSIFHHVISNAGGVANRQTIITAS